MQRDLSIPLEKAGGEAKLNFTRETNTDRLAANLCLLGIASAADPIVLYRKSLRNILGVLCDL